MPDHIHTLISPFDPDELISVFSNLIKRFVRSELVGRAASLGDWEWQEGCFDRLLRKTESIEEKWMYMRKNPVRGGLVTQWNDWPYQVGLDSPTEPVGLQEQNGA